MLGGCGRVGDHQLGVYVPLKALFLVLNCSLSKNIIITIMDLKISD